MFLVGAPRSLLRWETFLKWKVCSTFNYVIQLGRGVLISITEVGQKSPNLPGKVNPSFNPKICSIPVVSLPLPPSSDNNVFLFVFR